MDHHVILLWCSLMQQICKINCRLVNEEILHLTIWKCIQERSGDLNDLSLLNNFSSIRGIDATDVFPVLWVLKKSWPNSLHCIVAALQLVTCRSYQAWHVHMPNHIAKLQLQTQLMLIQMRHVLNALDRKDVRSFRLLSASIVTEVIEPWTVQVWHYLTRQHARPTYNVQ